MDGSKMTGRGSPAGIDELIARVQGARRAVAFTGAGMSTECGIPDFRSANGVWSRHKPIGFADFLSSEAIRLEAWRRYLALYQSFRDAKPGRGHVALRRLIERGHVGQVVTQNVDGLYRAAGVAPERIVELHGNGTYAKCLECAARHELDWVAQAIARERRAPSCSACGGIVKAATISFGQPMPEPALAAARRATLDADLFLSLGSSLQVHPAAGLPVLAWERGIGLIIVNREATALDGMAALVIRADLGDVLTALIDGLL